MAVRIARVAGKERRQMCADADRAHARPAAAVRDAEGLVEVEVADVGAEYTRPGEPNLRLEVRTVEIDLTTRPVDDVSNLGYRFLEHDMGRRIGDLDPPHLPPSLRTTRPKICH